MLFSTSLVALILSPRRLQITNTKVRPCSRVLNGMRNRKRSKCVIQVPFVQCLQSLADLSIFSQRQSTICELTFPTSVLAVRMNRKRLVVILEDQIYLYDISNMKLLYTIGTSPNPNGKPFDSTMGSFAVSDWSQLSVLSRRPRRIATWPTLYHKKRHPPPSHHLLMPHLAPSISLLPVVTSCCSIP